MHADQRLIQAAKAFIDRRFHGRADEGAAAMYTADGDILISTALAVVNASVSLCHETGAMCDAYARDKRVTATVCVHKDPHGRYLILPPCGVCQERLWYWGAEVDVAVPLMGDNTQWQSIKLAALSPHYWRTPFM